MWRGLAIGMLLFLILFPLVALIHAQGGTSIHPTPIAAQVSVGQTTSVEIVVEEVTDLVAVEVHMTFDPALVEVVDADDGMEGIQVSLGPFLTPSYELTNIVDPASGQILFSYYQDNPESGSGTIATITFRGKSPGTTSLVLTSVSLSNLTDLIPTTPQNGQVTVTTGESPIQTPSPTPIPPSPTPIPPNPTAVPPTPTLPRATPEPTLTPPPSPTATPAPPPYNCGDVLGYHTVRQGETVYAIGRAYGVQPNGIAFCNHLVNPSLIHPGLTLSIPHIPWYPIPPGPVARRQFGGPVPCRFYHLVQSGENLFRISLRYQVSMWAIAEANHIYNLNYIQAGQTLCIP